MFTLRFKTTSREGVPTSSTSAAVDKPARQPNVAKVQAGAPSTTGPASTTTGPNDSGSAGASVAPPAANVETGASGMHNKMDATKVAEVLSETNKMLKALTTQQATSTAATPPPLDPIEMIQKQLDEVRRLKVLVVREPGSRLPRSMVQCLGMRLA